MPIKSVKLTEEECKKYGYPYGNPNCFYYKVVEVEETPDEKIERLSSENEELKRVLNERPVAEHHHYHGVSHSPTAEELIAWGKIPGPSGL